MSNKLLAFLGTTKYEEAYHSYSDMKTSKPSPFIQEALVELFCKSWDESV